MERVVIALGGNALLRRGAEDTFDEMYRASRLAAEAIVDIAAAGWEVVVTHGNGPQVGRILLQQEAAKDVVNPMPLDVCGAESQGQIGYLLQVTIGDVFFERGMERPVVTILTLTRVRPKDPAFRNPTKFVGPFYEEAEARLLEDERGYVMKADPHGGWRRVVPSPTPYSVVETPVIEKLVADGAVVIASGGGGVPVIEKGPRLIGKEGVVDKDLAAAILAHEVGARVLLILTDVAKVQRGYGSLYPEDIDRMTVAEAKALLKKGEFGAGSMGPKVKAAINFVEAGGERAVIADLDQASEALEGTAGTELLPGLTVRIVTYNVRGFRDGRERVIGVIRELAPDVLLLQETGPRRALRRFAASLGMRAAHDPWSPFRRRVKNAVLAAEPWHLDGVRLVRFERATRWYPRGVLMARIHTDTRPLWAISVHLGLDGDERGRQAEELCRLVVALGDEPVVAGGDLNATPDRRSPARVAASLRDVWHEVGEGEGGTFPAGAPTDRIDYVFVRGPVQIEGTTVGGPGAEEASDHLPVSADIAVGRS